jgi:hypothetical protein
MKRLVAGIVWMLPVLGCSELSPSPGTGPEVGSEPQLIRHDSDPDGRWPVMLFLHGNGERGNGKEDLDWVLTHGPLYEAWIQKRDLPFIIVAPQLPLYGLDETIDYIRDRKIEDIPERLEQGVPARPEEFATPDRRACPTAGPGSRRTSS